VSDAGVQPANGGITTLVGVLDRLIPSDAAPGASDLLTESQLTGRVPALRAFLNELGDFSLLPPNEQDTILHQLDASFHPVFASLVEAAHELFYADPHSWPSLGYTTNIPGRP
jgi:hypothetical protein